MHSLFHRLFSMQWRDVLHFPVVFGVGLCAYVCNERRTRKADNHVICFWVEGQHSLAILLSCQQRV